MSPMRYINSSFMLSFPACVGVCAQSCQTLCNFMAPGAHQAPLSIGFPRQEHWSGLPFPSLGSLPNPGIEPMSPASPAFIGRFFTTRATWEVPSLPIYLVYFSSMLCHESYAPLWKITHQPQVPGKKVVEGSISGLRLPDLCLGFITYWLPRWCNGKESACQCRKCKTCRFKSLGWEDPLEEEMAAHSSILAWKGQEEPGRLSSMRLHHLLSKLWSCSIYLLQLSMPYL